MEESKQEVKKDFGFYTCPNCKKYTPNSESYIKFNINKSGNVKVLKNPKNGKIFKDGQILSVVCVDCK